MKVKVKATDVSKKYGIRISDVKRIVEPGEEFEVDESRLKLLEGKNIWGYKFVERIKDKVKEKAKPKIEEPIPVPTDPTLKPAKAEEPMVEEPTKIEKPVKKRTSKKKKESE